MVGGGGGVTGVVGCGGGYQGFTIEIGLYSVVMVGGNSNTMQKKYFFGQFPFFKKKGTVSHDFVSLF